jgi:hypothetical protein
MLFSSSLVVWVFVPSSLLSWVLSQRLRHSGRKTDSKHKQLRIYDTPDHLVLIINATSEEERGFAEELGMRMKVVGFELPTASR